MRRVGVLMPFDAQDSFGREIISALREGLKERGWAEGRKIRIDERWIGRAVSRKGHAECERQHDEDRTAGPDEEPAHGFAESIAPVGRQFALRYARSSRRHVPPPVSSELESPTAS